MSVTPELRFGQDEVLPKNAVWSFNPDSEIFGMVQLQLEIYINLCSLFFNTWNVFSKENFGKFIQYLYLKIKIVSAISMVHLWNNNDLGSGHIYVDYYQIGLNMDETQNK